MSSDVFSDLLTEDRLFPPPPGFGERPLPASLVEDARRDPAAFWAGASERVDWLTPWHTLLEWNSPHARWYVGGKLNLSANCLDRHVAAGRGNKAALIWEGEDGEVVTLTYRQLLRDVQRLANGLESLGVEKGDRVAIYMPMTVDAIAAMLACARIGAVHSVVFGGFSADSLADRINDAEAKVLLTADGGYRRGQVVPLKAEADRALANTPSITRVLVSRRHPKGDPRTIPCAMTPGRDVWFDELVATQPAHRPPEPMDSEDLLFILYTSGTTGKPKGIVHSTGGYAVGTATTASLVFDLTDRDVFWCTADIGWVTGHSYVVYGPLQNGATIFVYEGAPDFPRKDRFWDAIARHGVTIFYTAPTAIRAFMKWGHELPDAHDLSSLRLLGSVGEPINPEAWIWYQTHIGRGRCPVVDTWWQTETGHMMISGIPTLTTMKPGFAGPALPGIDAAILDDDGNEVERGSGILAIRSPWPGMLRTIWRDDERFKKTYFSRWGGRFYFPGDGAKRDEHGNFLILGRIDDVLNVAGHRIGTMEVESALVDHPAVAEAAVIGRAHELKGQAVVAFVTIKDGHHATADELKAHVARKIGAIARPEEVLLTADLPKTRSGKIMRRLLRDIAEGRAVGDTTTLADPAVMGRLRDVYGTDE